MPRPDSSRRTTPPRKRLKRAHTDPVRGVAQRVSRKYKLSQYTPTPFELKVSSPHTTRDEVYALVTRRHSPRKPALILSTQSLYSPAELAEQIARLAATHCIEVCEEPRHGVLIERLAAEVELLKGKLCRAKGVNAEMAGTLAWAREQARVIIGEGEYGWERERVETLMRKMSWWRVE